MCRAIRIAEGNAVVTHDKITVRQAAKGVLDIAVGKAGPIYVGTGERGNDR